MTNTEIEHILGNALQLDEVHVSGDGSHFYVIAVSALFQSLSPVKAQQLIYGPLMDYIANNTIHALSIKTFTPVQWQRERKLNGF